MNHRVSVEKKSFAIFLPQTLFLPAYITSKLTPVLFYVIFFMIIPVFALLYGFLPRRRITFTNTNDLTMSGLGPHTQYSPYSVIYPHLKDFTTTSLICLSFCMIVITSETGSLKQKSLVSK